VPPASGFRSAATARRCESTPDAQVRRARLVIVLRSCSSCSGSRSPGPAWPRFRSAQPRGPLSAFPVRRMISPATSTY